MWGKKGDGKWQTEASRLLLWWFGREGCKSGRADRLGL